MLHDLAYISQIKGDLKNMKSKASYEYRLLGLSMKTYLRFVIFLCANISSKLQMLKIS
jgi:hypothetical protein